MINDLSYRIGGLQENNNYEFKVAAVNAAGGKSYISVKICIIIFI